MKYVFSESLKDAYTENGGRGIFTLWTWTIIDAGKSVITQQIENKKGGEIMTAKNKGIIAQNKVFLWIAAGTAAILMLPYLAMQFNWVKPDPNNPLDRGVDWSVGDFIVMGALLFGAGSLFVFIARATPHKYRLLVGLVILALFFLTWVHLAVGIVDSWPLAGS